MLSQTKCILIATKNKGKAREFAELFGAEWKVETLLDFSGAPSVVEDGETFEANAAKKALEISKVYPGLVLADDSGLEVDSLNGAPGVYSARYAGEPSDDLKNLKKLLKEMEPISSDKRGAQFHCVLIVAESGKVLHKAEGICRGRIAYAPKGENGFGYDPVFIPDSFTQTFAELSSETKHSLSHRGKAMAKLGDIFKKI